MAENESGQEKSHAASERRVRKAKEEGQITRSNDLPRAATISFLLLSVSIAGAVMGPSIEGMVLGWLVRVPTMSLDVAFADMEWIWSGVLIIAGALAIIAAASSLIGEGWLFSLHPFVPDFNRLNPSKGLGQAVSMRSWIETAKSAAKFIIIAFAGFFAFRQAMPMIAGILKAHGVPAGTFMRTIILVLTAPCLGVVLLAVVDVWVHRLVSRRSMRMTDQEVKEERKENDADPHTRARQRSVARRMAQSRQMNRLAEASVIITNPTHYAVALRYRKEKDRAPILIAKGIGLLAHEIRQKAAEYAVPIVEAPPLARAIYRHVELDQAIPKDLYKACAAVLAYIWRLQEWQAGRETNRPERPSSTSLKISDKFDSPGAE